MRRIQIFLALTAMLAVPAFSQQTVTWTGNFDGFTFEEAGNWSPTPTGGVVNGASLIDNYVINNFNSVTTAGSIRMDSANAGDAPLSILVDGASLLIPGGGGIQGNASPATTQTLILDNFADVESQFLLSIHTELNDGAFLTLNGTGNPINLTTINFGGDLSGQINSAETVADFTAEHVSKITVEGCSAVIGGNLNVVDNGGTTQVTAMEAAFTGALDRTTGNLSFTNGSSPLTIESVRVTSASGALDTAGWSPISGNFDGNGDSSVDSDSWAIDSQTSTLLAESETPALDGATLASGQTIDFGNVLRRSPFADVGLEVTLDDGSVQPIALCSSGDTADMADFDVDGDVDPADWAIFRSNLFSEFPADTAVDAYFMGDLDGDLDNDENDFVLFEQFFDEQNGAGAFQAMIPEPGGMAMSVLFFGFAVSLFRSRKLRKVAPILLFALMTIGLVSDSDAQVVWTGAGADPTSWFDDGNWDFSASSVTTVMESGGGTQRPVDDDVLVQNANIVGGGYTFGFGSLSAAPGRTITFDNLQLDTSTGATITNGGLSGVNQGSFVCAGAFDITNGSNLNIQFGSGGEYFVDGTSTVSFRGSGNPINHTTGFGDVRIILQQGATLNFVNAANLMAGGGGANEARNIFAADANGNLVALESDPSILNISADGLSATAVNTYTPVPRGVLGLDVNTTTGATTLRNSSDAAVDLDFYKIESAAGGLNVAGWNSLEDQNLPGFPAGSGVGDGWEEAGGSDNSELGEAYLTGFSTLAAGDSINLGNIYDSAANTMDLAFTYRDLADNDFFPCADVHYVSGGVNGDFNGDGNWDCTDVDALVGAIAGNSGDLSFDMNGDGVVSIGDLTDGNGWLAVGGANNPAETGGNPFLEGDANLDGVVDVSDFNIWNGNKFTAASAWCLGDFTADGFADVSDFNVWNGNKFSSSDSHVSTVPEPNASVLALICGLAVAHLRRRK